MSEHFREWAAAHYDELETEFNRIYVEDFEYEEDAEEAWHDFVDEKYAAREREATSATGETAA